jgi:hypothetical protein
MLLVTMKTKKPFSIEYLHQYNSKMNNKQDLNSNAPLFLYIPVSRLILLSIFSFGFYEGYWIYKNWKYLKTRNGLDIQPFWRGIFGVFFCHKLLNSIYNDKEAQLIEQPKFSASGLATGWVMMTIMARIISRAPGDEATLISAFIPSFLCLIPIQKHINSVEKKRNPNQTIYGWSAGHIVCLVIGASFWIPLLTQLLNMLMRPTY